MRPQEAIDAWRRVLALDDRDFRALGALEQLFTQEARWEECIDVLEQKRARVLDDRRRKVEMLLQAASVWEDKIDDRDRAGDVYERILQLDAQNMTASLQLEQVYRAQGNVGEAHRAAARARRVHARGARSASQILQTVAEIYENEIGDQEGAFVVLQAAFRENYADQTVSGELERLATATNKWNELLGEYTQVVQHDPRSDDGGGSVGQDRPLVRRAPRPPRVRDRTRSSRRCARRRTHTEALENLAGFYRKTSMWRSWSTTLDKHAELRRASRRRRSSCTWRWPSCGKARSAIRRRRSRAYQQALAANPATHAARSTRSSGSTAAPSSGRT